MKAAYLTLGCKVNQYDTDAMEEILENDGFASVSFDECADVYLINTCTVTAVADKKSRQMIHKAHALNPDAFVIVCGCLSQRIPEEILKIEGVSAVIGISQRSSIGEVVSRLKSGEDKLNYVREIRSEKHFENLHISKTQERTRANIKICEGCENFCTYCIIPYARGPVRSRDLRDIRDEARLLAQNGVREVVLTGIHIASYGKDLSKEKLIDVIETIAGVDGIERIRLGSLEPSCLTREFCERASKVRKLCPHFHISLQSGSASVLKRMNRHYTPDEYEGFVKNARKYFDNPAITTDVIAGFAGETEEEHLETIAFINKIGFSKVHIFPYSERVGTVAAKLPGPVPKAVRKRRAGEIAAAAGIEADRYLSEFIGRTETVLTEENGEDGLSRGHNERYIMIRFEGGTSNKLQKVRILKAENETLLGTLIEGEE